MRSACIIEFIKVHLQYLPACLLRSCENREVEEVEEPFPRGKKRAAPLTVRKLSLMLGKGREKERETFINHSEMNKMPPNPSGCTHVFNNGD